MTELCEGECTLDYIPMYTYINVHLYMTVNSHNMYTYTINSHIIRSDDPKKAILANLTITKGNADDNKNGNTSMCNILKPHHVEPKYR